MTDRQSGSTINVDASIRLWHTCLQIGHDRAPSGVVITNNPLEYDRTKVYAQLVMHKTRSLNCAVQVARYARRRYELDGSVSTHRSARWIEAKIGYVCLNGYQYGPENVSEDHLKVVGHIAATSIKQLLEEVRDGINAARTRYIVYEVRAQDLEGRKVALRGVTNKFHAVEGIWRRSPPDTLRNPDLVHIAKCETRDEAEAHVSGHQRVSDDLWTRRPPVDYLRRVLRISGDDVVWAVDGSSAVVDYDGPGKTVRINQHLYTLPHIVYALEHGAWHDGYFRKASGPGL